MPHVCALLMAECERCEEYISWVAVCGECPYSTYILGWPEPYICTVYDRIFGNFPAKNTIYRPYIYGSGQPYIYPVQCTCYCNVLKKTLTVCSV